MTDSNAKDFDKLIDYVEEQILAGNLKSGDKLPPERRLSETLNITRNAVRNGLNILSGIGVIVTQQGSGNYISNHSDTNLMKLITILYALEDMSYDEVLVFRYIVEQEAVILDCQNHISDAQIRLMHNYLSILENSEDESERTHSDQMIHKTIVEAADNRLVTANYHALSVVLDHIIKKVRISAKERGEADYLGLQSTHRRLVEAVCSYNQDEAKQALDDHFQYVRQGIET